MKTILALAVVFMYIILTSDLLGQADNYGAFLNGRKPVPFSLAGRGTGRAFFTSLPIVALETGIALKNTREIQAGEKFRRIHPLPRPCGAMTATVNSSPQRHTVNGMAGREWYLGLGGIDATPYPGLAQAGGGYSMIVNRVALPGEII